MDKNKANDASWINDNDNDNNDDNYDDNHDNDNNDDKYDKNVTSYEVSQFVWYQLMECISSPQLQLQRSRMR